MAAPEREVFFPGMSLETMVEELGAVCVELKVDRPDSWSKPKMRCRTISGRIAGERFCFSAWEGELPRGQGASIVYLSEVDGDSEIEQIAALLEGPDTVRGIWSYPERKWATRADPGNRTEAGLMMNYFVAALLGLGLIYFLWW